MMLHLKYKSNMAKCMYQNLNDPHYTEERRTG